MITLGSLSCANTDKRAQTNNLADQEVSDLEIVTRDGRRLHFFVYLATNKAQRAQGLSFVTNLPPDHGMLFIFPGSQRVTMWMKNTLIPLDLLFIDAQGAIMQIVKDAVPHSTELIAPDGDADAVLELAAGSAQRLNIGIGDSVHHALLNSEGMDSRLIQE
jgi:hypothetical protein